MCVIVDSNRLDSFLKSSADEDSQPIREWIQKRKGRIIYSTGGKFLGELDYQSLKQLTRYMRNEQATRIGKEVVEKEIRHLENDSVPKKSNDLHILALARASGARLLYTADQDLKEDFKNKSIIDNPRGKIYSTAKNKKLLRPDICKSRT